jgi:hypothetical protein
MRKVTPGGEAATGKRRVLVAIGALLLLAIAGGVAWQQAWIGAPHPGEVRIAAHDPAKAKLEAELEAARQARSDAEVRAIGASADAVRARTELEAAALRAKAEAEAAATKAKAQSDAAALRAQAVADVQRAREADAERARISEAERAKAGEAERAKTAEAERARTAEAERAKAVEAERAKAVEAERAKPAEAERAKATSALAATVPGGGRTSGAPTASYDGAWTGIQRCGPAGNGNPAYTRDFAIVVADGVFAFERGLAGQPGYANARGRATPDGRLALTGTGVNQFKRTIPIRLDGEWKGDRFRLEGDVGSRHCQLEFARR